MSRAPARAGARLAARGRARPARTSRATPTSASTVEGRRVEGRLDIALRDLEHALGVDGDGDGAITWGELRARHQAIAAYALARLELAADGAVCPARPQRAAGRAPQRRRLRGAALRRRLPGSDRRARSALPPAVRPRPAASRPDPGRARGRDPHRRARPGAAGPRGRRRRARPAGPVRELRRRGRPAHRLRARPHPVPALLLLPAVLRRRPGSGSRSRASARRCARSSSSSPPSRSPIRSRSASPLGVVTLPSRLVESAIAASLVLAALNNLWPLITRRVWLVAFGFGLVHGFGFASVLGRPRPAARRAAAGAARLQPRRRGGPAADRARDHAGGVLAAAELALRARRPAARLARDRRARLALADRAGVRRSLIRTAGRRRSPGGPRAPASAADRPAGRQLHPHQAWEHVLVEPFRPPDGGSRGSRAPK